MGAWVQKKYWLVARAVGEHKQKGAFPGSPILLDVEEESKTILSNPGVHHRMEVEEPKIPSSICWRRCYPGFEKDVWSGWKFTGIPHCQRGIKALFWEGICHMKNLPLQTTVKPAQAESSVLQTALDWKGILILSRFKVQQKQGQWYLEKSNQRAAAEPNWEELLGLLLKLKHRGVLK